MDSPRRVRRLKLRGFLVVMLVVSAGFAGWSWLRPYAWNADPAARCRVIGSQVKRDRSNYWVDVHLKVSPGLEHDLMKPVRLVAGPGREIEPADTALGGDAKGGTTDLWFKFWLETADIGQPLALRINDGSLVIKKSPGMPSLGPSNVEYFATCNW